MIFRIVERGEVVPVGLDLGTVGDVETDRAEYGFDAVLGARERMQASAARAAPGQRDIERLLRQARIELQPRQCVAPRGERGFDALLRRVDAAARLAPLLGGQLAQPLEQIGERAGLAQKARLRLLQLRRIVDAAELLQCVADYFFQIIHFYDYRNEKRLINLASFRISADDPSRSPPYLDAAPASLAGKLALACSANLANAAMSVTARSASTLRSTSIAARLRPFMNRL